MRIWVSRFWHQHLSQLQASAAKGLLPLLTGSCHTTALLLLLL